MKRKMVWLGIPWLIGLYFAATCQISVTTSLLLAAFLLLGISAYGKSVPHQRKGKHCVMKVPYSDSRQRAGTVGAGHAPDFISGGERMKGD